jgi:hypothetical protein
MLGKSIECNEGSMEFSEEGQITVIPGGMTVNQLASSCGMSTIYPYYYFESNDDGGVRLIGLNQEERTSEFVELP